MLDMARLSVGMRRSAWAVSALVGELLESLTGDLIGLETPPGCGQPGAIRTISTFSVLTLIRQALNRLVGGYAMRTGRSSSGQDCPLSKTSPPEWVRRILPISCSYLGRTDPQMVCPRHEKSCLLRSGLGSNLSWEFDPSWTDGPLTLSDVREDSRELESFPSSQTTDITLWLIVHCERFGAPPDFSGRQPLMCCRTWEQPSTIGH